MGGVGALSGVLEEPGPPEEGVEATLGVALLPVPVEDWTPGPSPPDSRDTVVIGPNLTSSANTRLDRYSMNFNPAPMVPAWVCMGDIIICKGTCDWFTL